MQINEASQTTVKIKKKVELCFIVQCFMGLGRC